MFRRGKSCARWGSFASIVRFRARYCRAMVAGGIIIAVVMLLLLPVAVMLGGAIWSAVLGFLLVEDADARAPGS